MSNDRFYRIVIIVLLLLNLSTLAYLWLNNSNNRVEQQTDHMGPPRRGGNPVDRLLKEKLALTPEQEKAFQLLKEEHHGQMVAIQEEEMQLHKGLFLLLQSKEVDEAARDVYFAKLAENDQSKEKVTFEHFAKLRLILTPEQQPRFDELMGEVASHILSHHRMGKGGRRPPPKKDR